MDNFPRSVIFEIECIEQMQREERSFSFEERLLS